MQVILVVLNFIAYVKAICDGVDCPFANTRRSSDVSTKGFRCDYHYVAAVEGWLKYHEIPANWYNARLRCHLEGTTLASPLNYPLQVAIQNAAGQFGFHGKDIFIGVHATFSKGDYYSIEGVPLSQMKHIWAQAAPSNYNDEESCLVMKSDGTLSDVDCKRPKPYVCYKMHNDSEVLNECGTVDNGYIFSNKTGSCYKFHRVPRKWSRAYMTCAAEGGYLTIINSNTEADVLRKLFADNPAFKMVGTFWKDVAFIGFHDWGEHGEFLTINGETLQEAGYDKFQPGEPNNLTTGEYCGSIYRTALLNDLACENHYAFICEKSPQSLLCPLTMENLSDEKR